jgi:anti-sigma B factor antagonist
VFTGAVPVGKVSGMQVHEEQIDAGGSPVTVVTVEGFVDASTVGDLRDTLERLVREGRQRFVIGLAGVPFMDSSGLAALVQTFKRVRIGEGDVRIAGLQDEVLRVFQLVRLDRVFDLYPDAAAAVASFAEPG